MSKQERLLQYEHEKYRRNAGNGNWVDVVDVVAAVAVLIGLIVLRSFL